MIMSEIEIPASYLDWLEDRDRNPYRKAKDPKDIIKEEGLYNTTLNKFNFCITKTFTTIKLYYLRSP